MTHDVRSTVGKTFGVVLAILGRAGYGGVVMWLSPWQEGTPPDDVEAAYWVAGVTDSGKAQDGQGRYVPDGRVWWRRMAEIPSGDYAAKNFSRWYPDVKLYTLGSTLHPTTVLVALR